MAARMAAIDCDVSLQVDPLIFGIVTGLFYQVLVII